MAKKPTKIPIDAEARLARRRVLEREYATIKEFAEALIVGLWHHKDADGREIGDPYADIRAIIIRRFPKVTNPGPHYGKPTKMPIKELHEIACELNRNGVKLPFRRRKKTSKKK